MKHLLPTVCLLLSTAPALLCAQSATSGTINEPRPIKGVQELTFAASGGSNRQFSDSFGGALVNYGVYFNYEWQGVLRQTVNYTNPQRGSTTWNGSTRLAADYHITWLGSYMPFLGVNFGRVYGSSMHDSWTAGLEAGLKYYTQRKLFLFALAEYNWLFDRGSELDDNFGDGQIVVSAGIGFNF
jgi:hypothetical protein